MQNGRLFILGIVLACGLGADRSMAQVMDGPFVNPSNGYSYYLLDSNSWTASEAQAVAMGGHLATVASQSEDTWLYNTFLPYVSNPEGSLLIGFTDPTEDDNFYWTSGAPVTFTDWGSGEPNNLSTEIYTNLELYNFNSIVASQWNDIENGAAGLPQYGVVEIVPEPNMIGLLALAGIVMVVSMRVRRARST